MTQHRHLLRIQPFIFTLICRYNVHSCRSPFRIILPFNCQAVIVPILETYLFRITFLLLPTLWLFVSTLHFHLFPFLRLLFYLGFCIYYEFLLFLPGICESEIFWTNAKVKYFERISFPIFRSIFILDITLCFINYVEPKHNYFVILRPALLLYEGKWRALTAWCKTTDIIYRSFFFWRSSVGLFVIYLCFLFLFSFPSLLMFSTLHFLRVTELLFFNLSFIPCFFFCFLHHFHIWCCDLFTVFV